MAIRQIIVHVDGTLTLPLITVPCAIGRTGVCIREDKIEGDGKTPLGFLEFRRVYYRSDRLSKPETELECETIEQDFGWCDDPASPDYNLAIKLPNPAHHEVMWRADPTYDVVVVLGWNDDPPIQGKGSAIFLHVAKEGFTPTEGCVALALDDLLELLRIVRPGDGLMVCT